MLFPFSFMRTGGGFDPDAQAFFDRVTTAGGTLTTTEKNATNQLVLDMKSAGIWSAMKAVYPMVGASAAACAQNLKSSSFTGTFSSGWTFASTGVTPNGTSAYMDTTLTPSANLTLSSGHISVYNRTNVEEAKCDLGTTNGIFGAPDEILLMTRFTGLGFVGVYTQYAGAITNANSQGLYITNRNSTTLTTGFKNNSKIYNSAQTAANLPSLPFYLGAQNATVPTRYASKQYAFASIGDGLTDTQASNFYTAVQTFNQTLNRQVGAQIVSDADAQAYINRVYTAGGTLTNTEANAVNQLTIDMKAAGVWTSMKAVYPMVGSSAAACAQNLKSSSFTGTFSSGWTFASTGVTGNGTSAYMNTNFIPSSDYTSSTNFGLFLYTSSTTAGAADRDLAAFTGGNTPSINLTSKDATTSKTDLFDFNTARISVSGYNVEGFYIGSRTATNSAKLFRNGTSIGTTTASEGTAPSIFLTLGAGNLSSSNPITSVGVYSAKTFSFAGTCNGLTDTQASNFYTAVQAFQTTLARQVV